MFFFWRSKAKKVQPSDTLYDPATQSLVVDDCAREGDLLEVTVRRMTYCEAATPALKAIYESQAQTNSASEGPQSATKADATTDPDTSAASQLEIQRVVLSHSAADDYDLYGERGAEAVDRQARRLSRKKNRRGSSKKARMASVAA